MPVDFLKIVDSDVDLDTNGSTVTKIAKFSIENIQKLYLIFCPFEIIWPHIIVITSELYFLTPKTVKNVNHMYTSCKVWLKNIYFSRWTGSFHGFWSLVSFMKRWRQVYSFFSWLGIHWLILGEKLASQHNWKQDYTVSKGLKYFFLHTIFSLK